ncbi:hypothetical protein V8C86DRAFT_2558080 [Haematococcus lacustris]
MERPEYSKLKTRTAPEYALGTEFDGKDDFMLPSHQAVVLAFGLGLGSPVTTSHTLSRSRPSSVELLSETALYSALERCTSSGGCMTRSQSASLGGGMPSSAQSSPSISHGEHGHILSAPHTPHAHSSSQMLVCQRSDSQVACDQADSTQALLSSLVAEAQQLKGSPKLAASTLAAASGSIKPTLDMKHQKKWGAGKAVDGA